MAKTTVALITFLVVLSAVLVGIAIKNESNPPPLTPKKVSTPTPTPPLMTRLFMQPNPVTFVGATTTVKVYVDTSASDISGVQLELSYDPSLLSLLSLRQAITFTKEKPVVNTHDRKFGRVSYILNRSETDSPLTATTSAEVATLVFSKIGSASGSATTMITFLPKSQVTSHSSSVLTEKEDAQVLLFKPVLPSPTQSMRSIDLISPTR